MAKFLFIALALCAVASGSPIDLDVQAGDLSLSVGQDAVADLTAATNAENVAAGAAETAVDAAEAGLATALTAGLQVAEAAKDVANVGIATALNTIQDAAIVAVASDEAQAALQAIQQAANNAGNGVFAIARPVEFSNDIKHLTDRLNQLIAEASQYATVVAGNAAQRAAKVGAQGAMAATNVAKQAVDSAANLAQGIVGASTGITNTATNIAENISRQGTALANRVSSSGDAITRLLTTPVVAAANAATNVVTKAPAQIIHLFSSLVPEPKPLTLF